METGKRELRRSMGVWTGISVVIGTVIGSGIFFKQGQVLETAGGTNAGLAAWLIGGLITLAGGLTVSEVGSRIPETGGIYIYMKKLYGEFVGFLTGWTQVAIYAPAIIASVTAYFSQLFADFFGIPMQWVPVIGIITLILITAMNSFDNRIASAFQVTTTSIKLIPIAALIIFGMFFGKADALGQTVAHVTSTASGNFGLAILATLFAYDGWATLANLGGELKNPSKNLPRAIIFGLLIVILAYVGVTYGIYQAVPANQIVALDSQVPYTVAKQAFGQVGGKLLAIGILVSMAGTLNGKMLAFPRMVYAMADEGVLPRFLKRINKAKEPIAALWTTAGLAMILIVISGADWLSDMAVFVIWLFYAATFCGVFILRAQDRKNGVKQDTTLFKVPLYPLVPIIAIGGALFVLVNTLIASFSMVLISFVFVAIGIPVYYYYQVKNK